MKTTIEVKDHSVSGELFRLEYDAKLHMYTTSPKPSKESLPSYYASEDYISHTDGKRSLFEKMYQVVKGITLSRKQKLLHSYLPQKGSLLDIGAGTGDFLEYAAAKGWTASGVEPSEKARSLAKQKNVTLIEELPETSSGYDAITMWHVLEHVYDLKTQIRWIKNNLSREGVLFVAVPNFESYDASYYKTDWAAYDVPRHLYHFSKKSIELLFEEQNMSVRAIHPMKFDAYYVSLLSEKYKTGKMKFLNAFWNGWRSNQKARKTRAYSSLIYVIKHQ
ncbi:methyltransferase [Dokdonia pacifica]|uniref:Methyltransferase domain-containing protein n=1 Tax=Dokdonia pacifica TaxID=1627892 RepID=A0A238WFD5_9FLAO|nr:class I SAM-dependent methyltransferase [Dokdonia pacifica]GGG20813.1 methyltransferase [Dokdonia pacifica]SNR45290.1 Methyltransferase domain-containing protein [Dokdonia pacifica]